jgi:hypothetical protein
VQIDGQERDGRGRQAAHGEAPRWTSASLAQKLQG